MRNATARVSGDTDTFGDLEREPGVKQHLAHQDEQRDRRQREIHHRGDAVARQLLQARLTTEKQVGADDVDSEEREGDREAEKHQHGRAA